MNQTLNDLQIRVSQLAGELRIPDEDRALDKRDAAPFDSAWTAAFESVRGAQIDEEVQHVIDQIREAAFKAAYAATKNPDLAGYVSDDFELIARYVVAGRDDPFVNALWREYLGGRFPTADIAFA